MAHIQQKEFIEKVKNIYPLFFTSKKVLEIGSLNINGTIRDFFTKCNYIGLDLGEGKDVDIVCDGKDYNEPDNSFDVCASCECFEHNPFWKETFENMIRLCKSGGLVFFTCATTGRHEHGTTKFSQHASPFTINWDYYKNLTEKDFRDSINIDNYFKSSTFEINTKSRDLYFYGIKK